MKLKRNSEILIPNLQVAEGYWQRMMGLMGKKNLPSDQALFFDHCNAIQTCFMKFEIDCVFLDKNGEVKKVVHHVRPWRWVGPVWGARSVIEMSAGLASQNQIKEGDHLVCGH
jgi:hypothetical protein